MTKERLMKAAERAGQLLTAALYLRPQGAWAIDLGTDPFARLYQWRQQQGRHFINAACSSSQTAVPAPLDDEPCSCVRRRWLARPTAFLRGQRGQQMVELAAFVSLKSDATAGTKSLHELYQQGAAQIARLPCQHAIRRKVRKNLLQAASLKTEVKVLEKVHDRMLGVTHATKEVDLPEQARKGVIINVSDFKECHGIGGTKHSDTDLAHAKA